MLTTFNESFCLSANPDVAGLLSSGREHDELSGRGEGRAP